MIFTLPLLFRTDTHTSEISYCPDAERKLSDKWSCCFSNFLHKMWKKKSFFFFNLGNFFFIIFDILIIHTFIVILLVDLKIFWRWIVNFFDKWLTVIFPKQNPPRNPASCFSNVRRLCFPLFYMIVNLISLRLGTVFSFFIWQRHPWLWHIVMGILNYLLS